ncbi:unnamed protein product [Ectocarpus sp. 8 AP-2014]
MALQPSITVVEVTGDEDEEWGDEDEVVVWSKNSTNTQGSALDGDNVGVRGKQQGRHHPRGLLVASLANLAISYNVVNVGLALKIMAKIYPSESATDESLVSSAAILGMMAGQVIFGALGDCLGRQLALSCTLLVCGAGAAGSALLTFDHGLIGGDIFRQLLYWRVLLGIGAGGVYPLAATLARASRISGWCSRLNGGSGGDEDTGSTSVALMFSMQGVGYLAAHLTGFVLLTAFPEPSSLAWRSLLGLGAVLPLGLAVALALALARARRYRLVQSSLGGEEEDEDAMGVRRGGGASDEVSSPVRFWLAVRDKRRLLMKLVGTAGSWFLFDVTFYGNQLYEGDVLEAVFGNAESLRDEASQDSLVALVALPGYFVAVALISRMGPRRVQVQGFLAMALLFAVIGLSFHSLGRHADILMLLYSLTFFFSNFGPNSTTFMLPSLTFPDQVRSSLNGISAAAGKLGALAGSLMFKPAAEAWGVGPVLVVCAFISLAGSFLTLAFVDSGEPQPILVRSGESDDEDGALNGTSSAVATEGLEMTRTAMRPSTKKVSANSTRTAAVAASSVGAVDGLKGVREAMAVGSYSDRGGPLSPGPSREHPLAKPRGRGMGTGTGMYARVEASVNGARENGVFGRGNSANGFRREGSFGGEDEGGYRNLALGRTGGVEGEMEAGDGSRWGGDSDSSGDRDHGGVGDAGFGSELVEPA